MRIKRFIAPDMRTALNMVRDEHGPDAVILSNRATPEGIEVVAATDYDEALVQQALRAAAPRASEAATPAPAPAASAPAPRFAAERTPAPAASRTPMAPARRMAEPTPTASRADAIMAAMAANPARGALAARARAVFQIDHAADAAARPARHAPAPAPAVYAEATAPSVAPASVAPAATPAHAATEISPDELLAAHRLIAASRSQASQSEPGAEFRALLARLTAEENDAAAERSAAAMMSATNAAAAPAAMPEPVIVQAPAITPEPVAVAAPATLAPALEAAAPAAPMAPVAAVAPIAPIAATAPIAPAAAAPEPRIEAPVLRAVPAPAEDPALLAMRSELSSMRELIERQMDQLAIERLRGSAGRAHAFETLVACGCDENMAQSIASRIDASLAPADVREPMLTELARMITVNRIEPIDEPGVIALVGPTGAGKTTTIAKLAARYAARHSARDVALVTTDNERAGAREQLHVHGRRLGITVCEAEGPESLNQTLDRLSAYPLVLVDTAGYAARDRALLSQILWLRSARRVRSLLVLPANAHHEDMAEVIRRYRPASPEGVVLTKVDETGRLGAALSAVAKQDLSLAYTSSGQQVPSDLEVADPIRLAYALEKLRRAADNPLMTEDRHVAA